MRRYCRTISIESLKWVCLFLFLSRLKKLKQIIMFLLCDLDNHIKYLNDKSNKLYLYTNSLY